MWRIPVLVLALIAVPAFASSNDAAWRTDIDYFASELARLHVNPFTRISRGDFETAVQDLRESVPTLADHEIVAGLMRIAALLGDAHTTVYPQGFSRFPVELYWFTDGLFVIRATAEHSDLIGARLVAIENRPVAEVAATVAAVIPHENDFWLREVAPARLVTPEVLHALRVIPSLETAAFQFKDAQGESVDRVLMRVALSVQLVDAFVQIPEPLYLRDRNANYWYDYATETQTLYVQYNRCAEDPARPIAQFGAELGAFGRSHAIERVVLDLRHNGGGNSALIQPLFEDLFTSLPHIDDPRRFFVIIGPATFSSAMMNAFTIDQQTRATLIGRPTGGKPNHFGNVRTFSLPRSGLTVQYSTRYFELTPGSDPPAVLAEVTVQSTSQLYFAGRDAVMEWILTPPEPKRRRAVRP